MRRILASHDRSGTGPGPGPRRDGRAPAPRARHHRRARPRRDGRRSRARRSSPTGSRRDAYADEALPIEAGQTISQPFMVARMTELLARRARRPDPRDRHRVRLPGRDPRLARCRTSRRSSASRRSSSRPRRRASTRSTLPGTVDDPRGRRQPRRRGRRAVGRDHRHRRRAVDPRRPARAARPTAAGWSSRSGRATGSS